jgi:serine/threonine protein kinase
LDTPRATPVRDDPHCADTLHGVDTKPLDQLKRETADELPATRLLATLPIIRPRPSAPEIVIGQQLGPYRLVRQIGRGPKGIVFEAEDTLLNRPVAVKVLAPEMATRGPQWAERFLQEARLTSRVDHALILGIFAVGQESGLVYYAMPLMSGRSARAALKARGPFAVREATRIVRQAALALAAAHAHDLSHGNLKPSNLFITESGDVKIGDFSVPHVPLDPAAGSNIRPQDIATDLRLLGATYHWLLTGRPPVNPDNLAGAAIPPSAARVIATALSRRRSYASATEMADALADVLASSDTDLRPPRPQDLVVAIRNSELRAPRAGEILGKCLLLEQVGRGAAGIVFKARHQTLNIPVAVKVLHLPGDSGVYRQLRSEARLLAQLNHPHIVRVWDFEDDPAMPYLIMEYVEGPDLADVLNEHGRLPAGRAVQIAVQIADGLAAAQRLGIVHRDVKPGNILLGADGNAKLTDLGLATCLGHEANTRLAGTVAYMSPEQANGIVDLRSDIYSLGATLFHALTGRMPFTGTTRAEVIRKHAEEAPSAPNELVPAIPNEVSDVVLRMIAKDPSERFQSYDDLLEVLRELDVVLNGPRSGIFAATGTASTNTRTDAAENRS